MIKKFIRIIVKAGKKNPFY